MECEALAVRNPPLPSTFMGERSANGDGLGPHCRTVQLDYHNLGIDVRTAQLRDAAGRPHFLVDRGEPIRELVRPRQ